MPWDSDADWDEADRRAAEQDTSSSAGGPSPARANRADRPFVLHVAADAFVLSDPHAGSPRGAVRIDRRTGDVSAAGSDAPGGAVVMGICAVMGVLHLERESFLVVVSQATRAAKVCGGSILAVTEAQLLPFALLPLEKRCQPAHPRSGARRSPGLRRGSAGGRLRRDLAVRAGL